MSTYAEIVTQLVIARQALGWSQREVARRLGGDESRQISTWERGSAKPVAHNLIQWADVLGLDIEIVPREAS